MDSENKDEALDGENRKQSDPETEVDKEKSEEIEKGETNRCKYINYQMDSAPLLNANNSLNPKNEHFNHPSKRIHVILHPISESNSSNEYCK